MLADIKDVILIGVEDQQWLIDQFLPRAIEFGFKAIAIIKPDSYINKVTVESVSYKVDRDKLEIMFFDNTDQSKEWLKTK